MRSSFLRTLFVLGLVATAAPTLAQQAGSCTSPISAGDLTSPGKLQLSVNPTLPPLQSVDSRGELQGLNIELGKEIAKRLCLTMDFQRMDFPAMIPGLGAARFDGINTGMFWTEERSKIMFTVPYAQSAIGVIVPTGSKYKPTTPAELMDHTIAVDADTYQERWLRSFDKEQVAKGAKPMTIRAFITPTEVVAALRAGQADAAALPTYTTTEIVRRGQAENAIPEMGATLVTMAFRKRSIAEAVAKVLNDMKADGSYDKLLESVGMSKFPDKTFGIRGQGPAA